MWACLKARRCPRQLCSHQLQLNPRDVVIARRHISRIDAGGSDPTLSPWLDNEPSIDDFDYGEGQHGSSIPPTKHNLPLSPLMDPKLIAARERHRTPKRAPSPDRSAFSQKLRNNPYGTMNLLHLLRIRASDRQTSSRLSHSSAQLQLHRPSAATLFPLELRSAIQSHHRCALVSPPNRK